VHQGLLFGCPRPRPGTPQGWCRQQRAVARAALAGAGAHWRSVRLHSHVDRSGVHHPGGLV